MHSWDTDRDADSSVTGLVSFPLSQSRLGGRRGRVRDEEEEEEEDGRCGCQKVA